MSDPNITEYEFGLTVKARHDKVSKELKFGLKETAGKIEEAPFFLREWMMTVLLSSLPQEQRQKSAATALAMANKNQKIVAESKDKVLLPE